MRSEIDSSGQKGRSFIEEARRAQIMASAIEVIAEAGYAQASLARIAAHAGISKGVISYHFAGKDELVEQVVEHTYGAVIEHVLARMEGLTTATELLRAHITAVAEHMREHPTQVRALGEIFTNFRSADGALRYGMHTNEDLYQGIERIFRLGQESGEFRAFDVRVMAVTQQAAIDDMFAYWITHPGHDLDAHAAELADLMERACRA
ncbi:regulatory protein, TetR [[Actinomadura] parvosata subsp. kistnae]|uniref:TetR family transcriptional regulator n=1 Tax=[Actinomadura] parvosata subsp. kistnae TaxID=1909395 RepID=A0A1V0AKF5_9ACTN|nr:TetR/AcrR family transcriptional regulator [Nonomuraea sp. ATCC 55076]AQZ70688.1 TetR family transcriptional regulator [Nonomuraea sp. ATCC 55076]SPL99578.1 regulatory protein, TetR [Actinomadura parvosata subsp. kistnae]